MSLRFLPVLVTYLAVVDAAGAAPPVTDEDVPSPVSEVARRWLVAAFQAPLLEYDLEGRQPRSEAVRMLTTTVRGERLGPGVGWYDPGRMRHDWSWLASRFDLDHNGRITPTEFAAFSGLLERLDRDRDGAVTPDDLDWSERSPWVREESRALRFFRDIDGNGNGRISEQEMLAYFKRRAGEKGHLTPGDIHDALTLERKGGKRVSRETWRECLFAGDLGSPFEGPRVGEEAPGFCLATQDGKRRITLSDYRGKKPVVLIFGSFT
jgi:hypothetical protein